MSTTPPQRESYLRFRDDLPDLLRQRLQSLLLELRAEGILAFEPSVTVQETGARKDVADTDIQPLVAGHGSLEEDLIFKLKLSATAGTRNWSLGTLPWVTHSGSLVISGRERFMVMQLRPSPGVFLKVEEETRGRRRAQSVIVELRPERGIHLRLVQRIASNPEAEARVMLRGRPFPMTVLDRLYEDGPLAPDVLVELSGFARALGVGVGVESMSEPDDLRCLVRDALTSSRIGTLGRRQIDRRTRLLKGTEAKREPSPQPSQARSLELTMDDIKVMQSLLQALAADKIKPDDSYDLSNLCVYRLGDFLNIALDQWVRWLGANLRRAAKSEATPVGEDDCQQLLESANILLNRDTCFTVAMRRWTKESPLCQWIPDGDSFPISAAALSRRITLGGPGGLHVAHDRRPRELHPTHLGRLCPLDTPIGYEVGVALSLTHSARIDRDGLLLARYREVSHEGGNTKIGDRDRYLSVLDELEACSNSDNTGGWIAYPDQRQVLLEGAEISAHRGTALTERMEANRVAWIHAEDADLYSLVANLLPYRHHNHPIRGTMACNMLRQALPLRDFAPPAVATGYEPSAAAFAANRSEGDAPELAYGTELWVGYLPWYGWNFEDALVISESAAMALTSVHPRRERIDLKRSLLDHQLAYETLGLSAEQWKGLRLDPSHYDEYGILRPGQAVTPEMPLVIEPAPRARSDGSYLQRVTQYFPRNVTSGKVAAVSLIDSQRGDVTHGVVDILVTGEELQSPATLGDKLANRHGHKGVISRILPDQKMPYVKLAANSAKAACSCGEEEAHQHLQVLINPLSVVSRMNVGQLHELAAREGNAERRPCFDPGSAPPTARVAFPNPVVVGRQYILKLNQNAADKLNARAHEPDSYSAFVQQPLRGRCLKGGQRLGEMETWALMAHAAPALLREMMTLKSDNPRPRVLLHQQLLAGSATLQGVELPEALRTFAAYCCGLGLSLKLIGKHGETHDPLQLNCVPEKLSSIQITMLDQEQFKTRDSSGEVSIPQIRADRESGYHFHRDGLESEAIFGPIKSFSCACKLYRRQRKTLSGGNVCESCGAPLISNSMRRARLGHIELAAPVVNPFLLTGLKSNPEFKRLVKDCFGVSIRSLLDLWMGRFKLRFMSWAEAEQFITKATTVSAEARSALEKAFGTTLLPDHPGETPHSLGHALPEATREAPLTAKETYRPSRTVLTASEAVREYRRASGKLVDFKRWVNETLEAADAGALDLLVALLRSEPGTKPLVLEIIPVIPPALRRRLKIPGQLSRPHDITELYKALLRVNVELIEARTTRLATPPAEQEKQTSPDAIATTNTPVSSEEYRCRRDALQRAVFHLMCNHRLPNPHDRAVDWHSPGWPKRVRDSLASFLEGKHGLLVGHLLGKRVDYSGRAVIVVDPRLPMDACRLPLAIAVKLLEPLLLSKLGGIDGQGSPEERVAAALAGEREAREQVVTVTDALLRERPVLLNRQPTLHRLGLLAFSAQIGEGDVIAIPAQATAGFNADFDGDQMAVYLPVTEEARAEAERLFPSRHLWHPAHGRLATSLAQDLALGGFLMCEIAKGALAQRFESCADCVSDGESANLIDDFVPEAFAAATRSGLSFGLTDLDRLRKEAASTTGNAQAMQKIVEDQAADDPFRQMLKSKARGDRDVLAELAGGENADESGANLTGGFSDGALIRRCVAGRRNLVDTKLGTAEGGGLTKMLVHYAQSLGIRQAECATQEGLWVSAIQTPWLFFADTPRGKAAAALQAHLDLDPKVEVTGLLCDPQGTERQYEVEDLPNNFDQNALLDEHPARTPPRLAAVRIKLPLAEVSKQLFPRLYGRLLAAALPELGLDAGAALDRSKAERVARWLAEDTARCALVRSPMQCACKNGLCAACYGLPWSRGRAVSGWTAQDLPNPPLPVGIIAAQAIGEPGTQLALRKKHVAGIGDDAGALLTGIGAARALLRAIGTAALTPEEIRDTFDYLYRHNKLEIAPVHFETIVKGMSLPRGWLGELAQATESGFQPTLAAAARLEEKDPLFGLKERALLGVDLFGHEEGV